MSDTNVLSTTGMSSSNEEELVLGSYTPEEQVFHQLFPRVPLSEKLVESRQCALRTKKKKLVRMGKIYVSSLRFCFSSSFLSEPVMVRWDDVKSIQKTTGFVFEDIVVSTKEESYIFSGFITVGTDQVFKLLKTLWTVREIYASLDSNETPERLPLLANTEDALTSSPSPPPHIRQQTWSSIPSCIQSDFSREDDESSQGSAINVVLQTLEFDDEKVPIGDNPLCDGDIDNSAKLPADLDNDSLRGIQNASTSPSPQVGVHEPSGDRFKWLPYFPTVPKSETLIDDFQCSFVSGAHRLGRLYITTNYILFSSVMMAEGVQICFKDVDTVTKARTIMIFDGIVITLKDGTTYNFTNFLSLNAAFNILIDSFGAVKALVSPLQDSAPKTLAFGAEDAGFVTKTSEPDISKFPIVESLDAFNDVATDYGTALSEYSCFTKELIEPVVLPEGKTLLDVFKVCFDDGSNLLELYHEDRKDKNQKWEAWRPGGSGSPPFCGQRVFSCSTTIKAVVTKTCPFVEYHRYAFMNLGGDAPTLVVQLSSQVTGVMFSDSFRAETLLTFTQANSVVTMRVYGYIQFLRDVWARRKILQISLDKEMPKCYRKLGAMLVERLKQHGEGPFSEGNSQEISEENLYTEMESFSAREFGYNIKYLFSSLASFKVVCRADLFITVLGFLACMNGLFAVFFLRFDDNLWDAHEKSVGISFESMLQKNIFDLFKPFVMSVLSVGMVVFYRLVFDLIVITL